MYIHLEHIIILVIQMVTTVRINEDVKQLKIHSVKLGIKEIDLINRCY